MSIVTRLLPVCVHITQQEKIYRPSFTYRKPDDSPTQYSRASSTELGALVLYWKFKRPCDFFAQDVL